MTNAVAAVHVTCEVRVVHPPTIVTDEFHARGMALMDQLMDLEEQNADVTDMALAGEADRKVWTIEMLVLVDDEFEALVKALSVIRTALHALGDSTPGWPTAEEIASAFAPAGTQTERTMVPA